MVNLISNYNNLISQNKNLEKWKSTNEYVYFNMTDKYRDSEELIWNYNQSLRCREIFKYYNNKGGLLVSPSNYFSYNNLNKIFTLKNEQQKKVNDVRLIENKTLITVSEESTIQTWKCDITQ